MINNDIIQGFDDEKEDNLRIRLQNLEGMENSLLLYLNGYIDTYNSNLFQKRINKAINSGYIKLIFNCAGLSYVSSTGIGSFTSFLKAVKPKGGDLVLFEIQPRVYEVFQLLGFSQFFNIKENLEDAIYFFKKNKMLQNAQQNVFPKIFRCPICSRKLKVVKSGRFRCPECKTILAVDRNGQVFLG